MTLLKFDVPGRFRLSAKEKKADFVQTDFFFAFEIELTVITGHVHGNDLDQSAAFGQLSKEQLDHEKEENEMRIVGRYTFGYGTENKNERSKTFSIRRDPNFLL